MHRSALADLMAQVDFADFVVAAAELERRRLLQSGYRPSLQATYGGPQGEWSDRSPRPDEEDFRSFLMQFRLFWAKREPMYLSNVHDAVAQRLPLSPDLAAEFARSRGYFDRLESPDGGSIQYVERLADGNEHTLSERENTDRWIYGMYLHHLPRKRAYVEGLDPFTQRLMEHAFQEYLFSFTAEVLALAHIIATAAELPWPSDGSSSSTD